MHVRCRHCCRLLVSNAVVTNAHSVVKKRPFNGGCGTDVAEVRNFQSENCPSFLTDSCSYMNVEHAPDWIMDSIDQQSWTKGKLHCPHCNCRVGTFNFMYISKCLCNVVTTPPIRLINCKVDLLYDTVENVDR